MKHWKFFIATLIVAGFAIFQFCERIDNIQKHQAQVKALLDKFYALQEQRNIAAIIACYHPSNFVALSHGLDDYAEDRDQLQHLWQKFLGDSGTIKIQRNNEMINLNFEGNVAWVSSINRIETRWDSLLVALPYFFTGVCHRSGERWLLVQSHVSIPAEALQQATWQTIPPAREPGRPSDQIPAPPHQY